MVFYFPGIILLFISFTIAKGFINFDEEFIIFLCLFIVFTTLMEGLSNTMYDYAKNKSSKIKNWYLKKWNEHLIRLRKQYIVLEFLNNFTSQNLYIFYKSINSFFSFISYNFYLKDLYLNFLVKETFYIYELLENQALSNSNRLAFNQMKTLLVELMQAESQEFPSNCIKNAIISLSKKK